MVVYHPDGNQQVDCAQDDDNGSHSSSSHNNNNNNNIYEDESDHDSMLWPLGLTQGSAAAFRHSSTTTPIITTTPAVPVIEDAIMECLAAAVESHDRLDAMGAACWSLSPTVSLSGPAADPHFVLEEWQPRQLQLPSTLPAWMIHQMMDTEEDPPTDIPIEALPPAPHN